MPKPIKGGKIVTPSSPTPIVITPTPPNIIADDTNNTLTANHPSYPTSEILVSANNSSFVAFDGVTINVGNADRPYGYWKFKIKAATNRNESAVANSPAFTIAGTITTPDAPTLVADDVANTLSASSVLGTSEILVSENGGTYVAYVGQINVGNVARAAGYWKFKIKAATGRNESLPVSSPAFTVTVTPVADSYTLTAASYTSAGVYKTDGTQVRTLWNRVYRAAGTYLIKWDGTDDQFNIVPVDNYVVKVVSNNVTYVWQGVVGNTSPNMDEDFRHKALDPATNIVIIGTKAYYAVGYNEGGASIYQFQLNNIQAKDNVFKTMTNQTTNYICTDGTNLYGVAYDNYADAHSWGFAFKASDNSLVSFSNGSNYKVTYGYNYTSCFDHRQVQALPTGITVSNKHIYISYKNENLITITDKVTGASVGNITTIIAPTSMSSDGTSIWITANDNTIRKYNLNTDGSIGSNTLTLTGLSNIVDIRVFGGNIGVVDSGANQQVKSFNTTTGTLNWTFGQAGGIKSSPAITNDRFAFWKMREVTGKREMFGGICFASDGSFWICDPSNQRTQHYDTNRNYLEGFIFQRKTYTCYVNPKAHSRLIGNWIELEIDHTNSNILACWKQKYNWEGKLGDTTPYNIQDALRDFTTLSNGRTYGIVLNNSTGLAEIVELDPNVGLKFQGVGYGDVGKMYPNGDIYVVGGTALGETQIWKKKTLTGFDTQGWPIYSGSVEVLRNTNTQMIDARLSGAKVAPWEITTSNLLVNFRGNKENNEVQNSYHLRAINLNTSKVLWQTSPSTHSAYIGGYPSDGAFDIGNGSNYWGNIGIAFGKNIFWGYNGESWKLSQTNKWNHYHEDGLFIGQFGNTGPEYNGNRSLYPAFAGNSFAPVFIQEGTDYYFYHNDESVYSGLHRWKVNGMDTIVEQSIPISTSFTRGVENSPIVGDLMNGLPAIATLVNNTAGWTRNPTTDSAQFSATTGLFSYDKRKNTDLYIIFRPTSAGSCNVDRILNASTNLTSWTITGKLTFNGAEPNGGNEGEGFRASIDIVDTAGKIIVRFQQKVAYGSPSTATIYANNTALFTQELVTWKASTHETFFPLIFTKLGSTITISYNGTSATISSVWETGANMANPSILRANFTSAGTNGLEKFLGLLDFQVLTTLT